MVMKRAFRKLRSGVSHAGPHQHGDHNRHNPNCAYRCSGKVLEVSEDQFYLRVEQAHGRARRWVGHDVPFALAGAEIHDLTSQAMQVLRPGDLVEVRTRLARKPDPNDFEPVALHRIHILQTAPMDRVRQAKAIQAAKG